MELGVAFLIIALLVALMPGWNEPPSPPPKPKYQVKKRERTVKYKEEPVNPEFFED